MRKLKERLLEQIRLRDGAPPSAAAPEAAAAANGGCLRSDAAAAQDHFARCDASLQRVQAAMVAWAGALDALGSCTQAIAEELARHTMLVAQPTDPCAVLKGDRAERESAARCCRALQSVMTAVDRVVRPVHGAFLSGALRPLMAESQAEAREVREVQDEYRRRAAAARRGGADGELAPDLALVCNSTGPTTRQGRAEFAERALAEAGEQLARRIEQFRRRRAERVPEEIGTVLGCQLELSRRMEAEVSKLVPLFPHAASAMVDIALASTERPDGRENPRPTAFDQRSHVSAPVSASVHVSVRAAVVATATANASASVHMFDSNSKPAATCRNITAPILAAASLARPCERYPVPLAALELDSNDDEQLDELLGEQQDALQDAQQDEHQDEQQDNKHNQPFAKQRSQQAIKPSLATAAAAPPVPRRAPATRAEGPSPPLLLPSDAFRGFMRQNKLLESSSDDGRERECECDNERENDHEWEQHENDNDNDNNNDNNNDNEQERKQPEPACEAPPQAMLSDITNVPRAASSLFFPGHTCGELLPPPPPQAPAPRDARMTSISFAMLHEQFRVLL